MPILTPEERVGSTMAGKYRLESIIATGGMATVFAGVHGWTEREVAVKILNYEHARDPEIVRRFLQEARAAAQLKHPNVVDVLDMGQDTDGTVYLVLERLHGETLKARMKRGTLALHEIGSLLLPVMRAVASAHAKKVVHRDLKPDNIFLASVDGAIVPKLLDFGIAKVATTDSGSTRTGMMVGTPSYMAPEQVKGERDVGAPADVWSMGVVLHAALTGRVPFEAETSAAVLARVLTERARPVLERAPSLRPSVAAVIDRALTFEREARFADMGEMVQALEAALDGPSAASRAAPQAPIAPGPRPISVSDTPTLQLPGGDLEQVTQPAPPGEPSAAMLPAATPFAWAPAPSETAPPRAPSRLPWILGAAIAITLAIGGVAWGLLGSASTSEPTVVPLAPTPVTAAPVAPPPETSAPVAPPPETAAPVAASPVAAPPETTSPEIPAPAAAPPETTALVAPDAGTPSTSPSPTSSPSPPSPSTSPDRPRTPRTRTPQRGTGGALILH